MTKLSSSDLRAKIESAGISYLPADQVFYSDFPYKVEMRSKHVGTGLGGSSGKRSCYIDIADPEKARRDLAAFNVRIETILKNVEYRNEIREFVNQLPNVEYKTRIGGDNNLFYFRDSNLVLALVEQYHDVITSVTGPINTKHENRINEKNVLTRNELYYNKFRYCIEFECSNDFVEHSVPRLLQVLNDMDPNSYREKRISNTVRYYEAAKTFTHTRKTILSGLVPFAKKTAISRPQGSPLLYLADPHDYVYIKLLTAEHVASNHELVLFDELT